eukprot:scaffold7308_cov114-Isochrysis_galbana.AAC.9
MRACHSTWEGAPWLCGPSTCLRIRCPPQPRSRAPCPRPARWRSGCPSRVLPPPLARAPRGRTFRVVLFCGHFLFGPSMCSLCCER